MTQVVEPAVDPGRPLPQVEATPRLRTSARRVAFWVAAGALALVVALVVVATQGSNVGGDPLAGDNAAPSGSMALVEVLRDQGVDVRLVSTFADAEAAIDSGEPTTVLLYDPFGHLAAQKLERLDQRTSHLVLVDPGFDQLEALATTVRTAGYVDETLTADCDLPAVERAGVVSGASSGYRYTGSGDEVLECLGSGDDVHSLIQLPKGDGWTTVLGTTAALSNEFIAADGNAALALNLLGERDTLVWYLPEFEPGPGEAAGPPNPPWLTPALLLVLLAGIAAAIWRGRRMGPLVVEPLPVVVRASETMEGRARLYERSGARLRALDALRIGTVQRLARLCGLPRTATLDEIIVATAALSGRSQTEVRALLVDASPASDPELVQRSDDLLTLEREVAKAIRPGG